ncbi:MAG: hypothetical protein WCK29_01455 [archaeon]
MVDKKKKSELKRKALIFIVVCGLLFAFSFFFKITGFDINYPDPPSTPSMTDCISFTYSAWSSCFSNGTQTRNVISALPSGCVDTSSNVTQSCVYISDNGTSNGTTNDISHGSGGNGGSGGGGGGGFGSLTVSNTTNNATDVTNLGVNDITNNADNSGILQSEDNSTASNSSSGFSIVSLMVPIIYVLLCLIFLVILIWFIVNRIKRNRYNSLASAFSEEKSSPVESSKSKKTEVISNNYNSAKKIINEIDKNLKNKDANAARENYNKLHDLFKLLSKSEKDELYEDSMRLYSEIEKLS